MSMQQSMHFVLNGDNCFKGGAKGACVMALNVHDSDEASLGTIGVFAQPWSQKCKYGAQAWTKNSRFNTTLNKFAGA